MTHSISSIATSQRASVVKHLQHNLFKSNRDFDINRLSASNAKHVWCNGCGCLL